MKFFSYILVFHFFFLANVAMSETSGELGADWPTKPFWNLKHTFRSLYKLRFFVEAEDSCDTGKKYSVGAKSIFRVISDDGNEKLVSFNYINDPSLDMQLNTLYKVCGDALVEYKYRRAGGVDVGMLVIPFKVRDGDLFGDASLGPYFVFKGSSLSMLFSFGLTQVSVSEVGSQDVNSETGLTAALGVVLSLNDDFDIGLVAV